MEEVSKLQIQTKIRKIVTYLLLVFCATSFYFHKFIPEFSNELLAIQKEYKEAKKENTIALKKVKEYAKGSEEYKNYKIVNKKKNKIYKKFIASLEGSKVFVFQSFHHFIERFGLMLCIFIYAFYNLVKSFLRERNNIGAKVIHSFILSITFFYFFWIFQSFQDLHKVTYVLVTFLSSSIVVFGVHLTTKYYNETISKLREQMFIIARLGIRNAKVEKKESLLKDLRKITYEK